MPSDYLDLGDWAEDPGIQAQECQDVGKTGGIPGYYPECIIDSIKESRSSSAMRVQGAGLLSQEGFVKEQKDYIDSLGPGPLDVWYLGGSLLEILLDGSALLERSIVDNLGSGVDYHVVWALDCPDRRLLERSMSLFSKIGAAITGQAGRINHHGVFLFRHEDYDRDYYYDSCPLNGYFLSEIVDSYQRCGKEGIPGNLFNPVTPLCQVLQKRLIGVFSPFATTIVYVPRGIYRPTAAVYMVGVTPSRSGPELNGFRFFDDDRAVELSMIVKEIKRYQKE